MTEKKEILDRLFFVFALTLMSVIVLSNLTGILPYDVNWILTLLQETMVVTSESIIHVIEGSNKPRITVFLQIFIIVPLVTIYFFTLIFTPFLVIVFVLEKILKSSNKRMGKNT